MPSFPVTHAILWGALGETLIQVRELTPDATPLPSANWDFQNLLGDAVVEVIHFFVGILILTVIETDFLACLKRITVRTIPPRPEFELDEDVLAEEERVCK